MIKYDPRNGSQLATIALEKHGLHQVFIGKDALLVTAGTIFGGQSLYKVDPGTGNIIADLKMKNVVGVANGIIFRVDDAGKPQMLVKVNEADGTERGATPSPPDFSAWWPGKVLSGCFTSTNLR